MRRPDALSLTAGFTLVELLIGAALSATIMAAVLSGYIYLGRGFGRLVNQQALETESRRTLAYLAQDVQAASGLNNTPSPSNSRLDLLILTATGTNIVTYYYNGNAPTSITESDDVSVNGTTVKMKRQCLTRCVYNYAIVTSQILLRNITDRDASTTDLYFRYYDASGVAYDNGSPPFTTITSYSRGIKAVSLQFSLQTGAAGNGTQTPVHQVTSGRLTLRNKNYLQ